jgi:hypothetical protein
MPVYVSPEKDRVKIAWDPSSDTKALVPVFIGGCHGNHWELAVKGVGFGRGAGDRHCWGLRR